MINKNKEEIEKIKEEIKSVPEQGERVYFGNIERLQERIKTSILWCEWIELLEYLSRQMISADNMKAVRTEIEMILKKLQNHLTYLKKQDKEI